MGYSKSDETELVDSNHSKSTHMHLVRRSTSPIPQMINQASRSFSAEKTTINRYSTQCSTTFNSSPVVPDLTCIVAPDSAHLSPDSALLRIGGKFFFCKEGGSQDLEFAELKGSAFPEFWEDGCCREDFIVLCRRRVPRPRLESNEDEGSETRREKTHKTENFCLLEPVKIKIEG